MQVHSFSPKVESISFRRISFTTTRSSVDVANTLNTHRINTSQLQNIHIYTHKHLQLYTHTAVLLHIQLFEYIKYTDRATIEFLHEFLHTVMDVPLEKKNSSCINLSHSLNRTRKYYHFDPAVVTYEFHVFSRIIRYQK